MADKSVMTQIKMLQRQWTQSRKWGNFVMTNIQFFNRRKILKLAELCEWVERKDKNLDILESADEVELSNFQIGKIGKLQDRRILNIQPSDIKLILAFK